MKLVYTHDNITVVHSAKNILALNNIAAFVKGEHVAPMSARHGIENTYIELWINHDEDYEKASTIIENQLLNPELKESWVCTEWKEENDGSFEVCWKCQTEVVVGDQQKLSQSI